MRPPKIPNLLDRKIYKTGQTRGADDDQIFQNRVGRSSTVLIPLGVYLEYDKLRNIPFEKGLIVLLKPTEYFGDWDDKHLAKIGLCLGENALIFYEIREDWNKWNPIDLGFSEPSSRTSPLGGQFVARIANTTASKDKRINIGYTSTGLKGAGIRLYEYASNETANQCRAQLEAAFWCAVDATETMLDVGMTEKDINKRSEAAFQKARDQGLLDFEKLKQSRILNGKRELVCPLCLERLSARGFIRRLAQAAGRERHDLTVTEINLFHIQELAFGVFNHRPYNLGWGHHHCNVVCKDSGIDETLTWMQSVLRRNEDN